MSILWILTEEKPKTNIVLDIFMEFAKDNNFSYFLGDIRIIPIVSNNRFTFEYDVIGITCNNVPKIKIRIISGNSSFVDYLVYFQEKSPKPEEEPLYAIEVTKTTDGESRNTGVYQRGTKFVFLDRYYPNTKKIMLYDNQIEDNKEPTDTNIFGNKMLTTNNVSILGKELKKEHYSKFKDLDDLIRHKNSMRRPPNGNVPLLIKKEKDLIKVSGRLFKSGSLAHDPNIGALSLITSSIRKFDNKSKIIITQHGLKQNHLTSRNKFIAICNLLNVEIEGLQVPKYNWPKKYWHYEEKGEKLGTIFIHIVVENFTKGYSIFDNHAGSEKGYFVTSAGDMIPLQKYTNRDKYKSGDKDYAMRIPDLILVDPNQNEIINIEGKTFDNRFAGINELKDYDFIEKEYIKKHYSSKYKIIRSVVLYGKGNGTDITETEIGFLLTNDGKLEIWVWSPSLFKEAIKNLKDFWR